MQSARLILDPPAPGAWNMAVDESLLRTAAEGAHVTLRIYRWQSPTLSLGYFQHYAQRLQHAASRHCPVVRRVTGGGAIVHDQEVTYSLTAPVAHRTRQPPLHWYQLVHSAWVATLGRLGALAEICPRSDADRETEFLCFQRRAAGDVLLGGWKIAGSAQRRHRAALLQHGSLLLGQSSAAPELPGISQLANFDPDTTAWVDDWVLEIGNRLGVVWETATLTNEQLDVATKFAEERFANPKWTLRR